MKAWIEKQETAHPQLLHATIRYDLQTEGGTNQQREPEKPKEQPQKTTYEELKGTGRQTGRHWSVIVD